MIRKILLLLLCISAFSYLTVNAKEDYTNKNGIKLDEIQYKFITDMYFDGYQKYLTLDEYNIIFSDNNNVKNINSSSHSTASKTLTINSSCSTTCLITVTVEWKKSPVVRSYDLIGAYFQNVSLYNTPVTNVINSYASTSTTSYDSFSNGFGVSAKLHNYGNDMMITQTYRTTKGGNIYASYQHAKNAISLADSKEYTISYSGFGHVFLFNNLTIQNHYDGMGGVNLSV